MTEEGATSVNNAVASEDSPCVLTRYTEMDSFTNLPKPTFLKSSSSPGKMISDRRKPPLTRAQSIKEKISHETARFFGVLPQEAPQLDDESVTVEAPSRSAEDQKWQQRRFRHLKQYGIKAELVDKQLNPEKKIGIEALTDLISDVSDRVSEKSEQISRSSRTQSIDSQISRAGPPILERRDSVAKMAMDTLSSFVKGDTFKRSRRRRIGEKAPDEAPFISVRQHQRHPLLSTSSFLPRPLRSGGVSPHDMSDIESFGGMSPLSVGDEFSRLRYSYRSLPTRERHISEEDVPQTSTEQADTNESVESEKSTLRIKPKLSRAERIDIEDIKTPTEPMPERPTHLPLPGPRVRFDHKTKETEISKFPAIDTKMRAQRMPMPSATSILEDEVFFNVTPCIKNKPAFQMGQLGTPISEEYAHAASTRVKSPVIKRPPPFPVELPQEVISPEPNANLNEKEYRPFDQKFYTKTPTKTKDLTVRAQSQAFAFDGAQKRTAHRPPSVTSIEAYRIRDLLQEKEKNIAPPLPTLTPFQRFNKFLRRSIYRSKSVTERSFKTLSQYFHEKQKPRKRKQALPIYGSVQKNLKSKVGKQLEDESCDYRPYFTWYITIVQIVLCIYQLFIYGIVLEFNAWADGADLVHMGAKYTPCMRHDRQIYEKIFEERSLESETGCCIGIDGCYQTSECPRQFASFMKFTNSSPSEHAVPAVCGQDPRYCRSPRSIQPFEWGDNITSWPICEDQISFIPTKATHMHCEIVGRPCCIQMQGQCRITTKEYCDFVRGYYHENATLCSQVDCLNEICGMTPFVRKNQPDQFYRFVLPLFIHAGIFRLLITVYIQFKIMRKFEIAIGWVRLSIIYMCSGIGGYLASATFEPYMPETGPAGSQTGVLSAIIVDIIYSWKFINDPSYVLFIHLLIAIFLLITGFLPFIDNWAQIFGFIFGALWAAILIPYIGKDLEKDRTKKLLIIGICALSIAFLYLLLIILFISGYELGSKSALINCPFPGKVCEHQGSQLKSWLPI